MKVEPTSGVLRNLYLAAEKVRQFAADGETEAGAAVFAAGGRVRLLERFEDELLLLQRNADAGVGDLECHHGPRLVEHRMLLAPAVERGRNIQLVLPPCAVNLKALESRFLRTCCRRLESVVMLRPRLGSM